MSAIKKAGGTAGIVCSVATIIAIVVSSGQVRTNQRGLELIGNAEACRRAPYVCPAGVLTDGIGNTHGVKVGTRKTDEQIAADWERNILLSEACVNKYAGGQWLSDNIFSAVTSLTFNAGCGAMKKSTMYSLLSRGKYIEACNQFPRWVYAGGVKLNGLVNRREAEKTLCMDGV